jgi:hypothetical protein
MVGNSAIQQTVQNCLQRDLYFLKHAFSLFVFVSVKKIAFVEIVEL